MQNNEELYSDNILELYRNPLNKREIAGSVLVGKGANPSCGDAIVFYIALDGEKISDASFTGEGCAISQAAGSMLTEKIKGIMLNKIRMLTPGDIYTMLGIHISPARVNCALLAYEAMNRAIKTYDK